MTNVHAMIHKWTDDDHVDQAVPTVELCIHGAGDKYHRGLSVVDDSSPAVQRLKLLLAECENDGDGDAENRLAGVDVDSLVD